MKINNEWKTVSTWRKIKLNVAAKPAPPSSTELRRAPPISFEFLWAPSSSFELCCVPSSPSELPRTSPSSSDFHRAPSISTKFNQAPRYTTSNVLFAVLPAQQRLIFWITVIVRCPVSRHGFAILDLLVGQVFNAMCKSRICNTNMNF